MPERGAFRREIQRHGQRLSSQINNIDRGELLFLYSNIQYTITYSYYMSTGKSTLGHLSQWDYYVSDLHTRYSYHHTTYVPLHLESPMKMR
jgi:hypothetical protein